MAQSILVKSKEIRVKNTNMVVEDENRAEVVEFSILNAGTIEGVSDMAFYVQYRNKLDEVGMDVLVNAYPSETIHNDMLVLDWLPSATFSKERGKVEIQIVGFTQTLEPTEDTTYKSGKLYFDENGEFIPVYPATSTHSPKVGDAITGTVYENEITADDHRWSSEKAILTLPENIYDTGTPIYTEEQVKNFITELNEQITIAKGYAEDAEDSATASATSASEAEDSADSAETNALKSEGFAVGEQNGTAVGSDSPYKNNNSKYYNEQAQNASDKAEDWATKTNGKVDNIDYSAKHYASEAADYAEDADNARILSVSETQSPDDGGTNVVVITYKDGTTFTFFVKNGHAGTPFTIYKTYSSIAEMNADFANVPEGIFVIISSSVSDPDNSKMFVRGAESFTFVTDLSGAQGIQGPAGQAATITVGTVTTGVAGSSASIVNSGTSAAAVFDFVIPRGDKGEQGIQGIQGEKGDTGNTPVLSIGTVTYGDTPTVTIDTTDPDHPVLNFVLKTSEVGVVDNLNSSSAVDALSAKQGKVLKGLIDSANGKINQHESRLENLEQKAGDYTTVQYRGTNAVPTGKAKNGLVEKIVGKSRAWNQLYNYTGERTKLDVKATMASGAITLSGTSNSTGNGPEFAWTDFTQPKGHAYVILTDLQLPAGDFIFDVYNSNYVNIIGRVFKTTQSFIIPQLKIANSGVNYTGITGRLYIRDLSVIFPEYTADELVSMGWDTLVQMLPDLAKFDSVNLGSLVSTEVSGVKSVGVNLFDGETQAGYYDSDSNGVFVPDSGWTACKNAMRVKPNTDYYCMMSTTPTDSAGKVLLYDSNMNKISSIGNHKNNSFTTPTNCVYIKFYARNSYFNYDIQFCLDSYADKTTYHHYMTDTLSLSETVTLRSAESVADTDELNVEVNGVARRRQTIRTNEADLGQCYWYYDSDYSVMRTNSLTDMSIAENWSALICAKYLVVSSNTAYSDMPDKSCKRQATTASFVIKDSDLTVSDIVNNKIAKLLGVKLIYETATHSVTLLEPIIENFIEVEGGGTINTIQEQSPVIDNCLDVGYLTV